MRRATAFALERSSFLIYDIVKCYNSINSMNIIAMHALTRYLTSALLVRWSSDLEWLGYPDFLSRISHGYCEDKFFHRSLQALGRSIVPFIICYACFLATSNVKDQFSYLSWGSTWSHLSLETGEERLFDVSSVFLRWISCFNALKITPTLKFAF